MIAIAADSGFKAMKTNSEFIELKITLNITAEDEHEPYIKRFNRTLNEMYRMGIAGVPFTILPKRMVVELVYTMVYWFNYTIPEDYVSNTLGPGAIILGKTYDYNKMCGNGSKSGEYAQTHKKITHTIKPRKVSAICMRPTENTQGSFYYYSIWSGYLIHRRRHTPLLVSQEVIIEGTRWICIYQTRWYAN